uniref:Uncharacterized protein n=1 Tax=Aegilops tauschii TaxID=37682 RepID=R7W981_AEGTA
MAVKKPEPQVLVPAVFDFPPLAARTRDLKDPNTFVDFLVSTSKPTMRLSSSIYYPKYRFGAFGTLFPLNMANRACPEDYGVMGLRYGGSKHPMPFTDLKNWNCAIGYGVGSSSPLSPSFNFALELVRSSQVLDYRGGDETLNYIDLGLELATRVDKDKPTDDAGNSSFQGKLGPSKSSAALAYKFPPFFTCSITVENDHSKDTKHLIESVRS